MGTRSWILIFAVLASACGGSDDDGGGTGGGNSAALNSACYAMCDQQEKGDNCIADYTKICKGGCDSVTPSFASKCPDVAKAYYDCNAGIDYQCTLALPSAKDPTACKAENDAMSACTK